MIKPPSLTDRVGRNLTEDVSAMTALIVRVQRAANRYEVAVRERDEELELLLKDIIGNMVGRCNQRGVKLQDGADWLLGLNYDETYAGLGQEVKYERSSELFNALERLCGNDTKLFLDRYRNALNNTFTMKGRTYEWNPKLVVTASGHRTVLHDRRRRRNKPAV